VTIHTNKWTKINVLVNVGICLGNNQGNFQSHRLTTSENIAKSFSLVTCFDSHCICQNGMATDFYIETLTKKEAN